MTEEGDKTRSPEPAPGGVQAFIPPELRPSVDTTDETPVVSPEAPLSVLRRRASEVLGSLLRGRRPDTPNGIGTLTTRHTCIRSSSTVSAEVEGEAVLLNLANGHYFSLNQLGAVIWDMLTGENNLGDIHGEICSCFEVEADTAWEDLTLLVRRLCEENLARVEEPSID